MIVSLFFNFLVSLMTIFGLVAITIPFVTKASA